MVDLTDEDRRDLIIILKDVPELFSENSRRQVLELAGLKKLSPMIDLSGSQFIATTQMVSYLANYGRVTYEHEALGLFLNVIKNFVGLEQQEFLNKLLTHYKMMTPIVTPIRVDTWHGRATPTEISEKIIGENTLRPISFLTRALEVARSVAYIGVHSFAGSWSGTGFLITQDLLLTNHHVLPDSDLLSGVIYRFNYEDNFQGEAQTPREYKSRLGEGVFHTNKDLDYTLVQLEGEPGREWGWLSLQDCPIGRDDRVNIIQHPFGQPKQISLQNNFVDYIGGHVIQYVTSTLEGSSGSPVLNDRWEVVALHHAGGNVREPTTQRRYYRNEGILIRKILADLPAELKHLLKA